MNGNHNGSQEGKQASRREWNKNKQNRPSSSIIINNNHHHHQTAALVPTVIIFIISSKSSIPVVNCDFDELLL